MWLTFRLGGHCKGCRAFTQAVSVGRHHPECVLSVGGEVVDGDLQFSWSCGVLNTFSVERERERGRIRGTQFQALAAEIKMLCCYVLRYQSFKLHS